MLIAAWMPGGSGQSGRRKPSVVKAHPPRVFAQHRLEVFHVRRARGLEGKIFTSHRMDESQPLGMQGLAAEAA